MSIRIIYISFLLIMGIQMYAQDETTEYSSMPEFKMLRAQEDYTFLSERSVDGFLNRMKYLHIGRGNYLSIGGNIRSEGQILLNEDWDDANSDVALFQRFMIHGDLHLGKRFRFFTQLKNGFTIGRNGPQLGLDEDLDIHQMFIGYQLGNTTIELGRRELRYGSSRLISIREGTNIRQSFDGARLIRTFENNRVDVLLYAYNPQVVGNFNNRINTDQLLWGAYWVHHIPNAENLNFDFYYLGVRNREGHFEEGQQEEARHSIGLRHWGSKKNLEFNNEALFQFGSYGAGTISAWTISSELYYRLPGSAKPTIGMKAEIISGDRELGDGRLQTFNALYPRGGYFGLLALIGPANLIDIHPSFSIQIGERFTINADWDVFWRQQLADGIYFPSGRLNIAGSDSDNRFIGHQAGLQMGFRLNQFVEFECSVFHFFAGSFLQDVTPGDDFTQIGTSVSVTF